MTKFWENPVWKKICNNKELLKLFVSHWQWFLLSMIVCFCFAYLYAQFATPVYKITCRLLVNTADDSGHGRYSRYYVSNVQNVGTVSNTTGVENEAAMIWSTLLMKDVVKELKLYATYKEEGRFKNHQVYATQPITVDLDARHLDMMDSVAYDEFRSISLKMVKPSDADSTIIVKGYLVCGREKVWGFSRRIKKLPASIRTPYGRLKFTRNPEGSEMTAGTKWHVTIYPPLYQTLLCLRHFSARPAKRDKTLRTLVRSYYKMSSMVNMAYADQNVRRGMDILKQVAICYNRQANADKDEKARCVEQFINQRLTTLSEELGDVDSDIVSVKKDKKMTGLRRDASVVLRESNRYSTQLMDAATQSLIIDDLNEYMANPAHDNALIPSAVGLKDRASLRLIAKYNSLVQQRNRLLQSASSDAVQVKSLNTSIAEMRSSITTALKQAKAFLMQSVL